MADLGRYAAEFAQFSRMLEEASGEFDKLIVFRNAAKAAAGFVSQDLPKSAAADELEALREQYLDDIDVNTAQDIVAKAFANGGGAQGAAAQAQAAQAPQPSAKVAPIGPWLAPNFEINDENIASAFTHVHGEPFAYSDTRKLWRQFRDGCWHEDTTLALRRAIRDFLRSITAVRRKSKDRAKLGSIGFLDAVERKLRILLAVDEDIWDADPFLLNCPGGTIDLRLDPPIFRGHEREDYLTKMAGCDPGGNCPKWRAFVDFVAQGDEDLQLYLQQLCGYSLVGTTDEQIFCFFWGEGNNGKSVFREVWRHVLGSYAGTCASDALTARPFEQHPEQLMVFRGTRLVLSSELATGAKWHESRLKDITGGDKMTARLMRENSVEFPVGALLIVTGNEKPELRSITDAIKRRLHLVPWLATVSNVIKRYEEQLKPEASGILQWMIDGYKDWRTRGLQRPAKVSEATDEYVAEQDYTAQWLGECTIITPGNRENNGVLFRSWEKWAKGRGAYVGNATSLGQRIARTANEKGHKIYRRWKVGAKRGFENIELIRKELYRIVGTCDADVVCERCREGRGDKGDVYKIKGVDDIGGKPDNLHRACAEERFKPNDEPEMF